MRSLSLSIVVAFALAAAPVAQRGELGHVVARARAYLDRYHDELSTTIAEEHYEQTVTPQFLYTAPRVTRFSGEAIACFIVSASAKCISAMRK